MRGRAGPHLPTQGYIEYPPPGANVKFFYNSLKLTTMLGA